MEINPEIKPILKHYNINYDAGILVLLGIHFKLDVDTVCPTEVVNAINLTKIVEKDYNNKTIVWNIALFAGQDTIDSWAWVLEMPKKFGAKNPERKGDSEACVKRMQDFFAKYPHIRKEDVMQAINMYLASVKDVQYLMKSHKFIMDGIGAMKKSELLTWCEKVTKVKNSKTNTDMKGKMIK